VRKLPQKAGKGHNEILEGVNPVEHTRCIADAVHWHVPENGGTCMHIFASDMSKDALGVMALKF
jgi:hypothetical protein